MSKSSEQRGQKFQQPNNRDSSAEVYGCLGERTEVIRSE